jgi:hypothetical protein
VYSLQRRGRGGEEQGQQGPRRPSGGCSPIDDNSGETGITNFLQQPTATPEAPVSELWNLSLSAAKGTSPCLRSLDAPSARLLSARFQTSSFASKQSVICARLALTSK